MYEHRMFKVGTSDKKIDVLLDEISMAGWEAVGMATPPGGQVYILCKRPRS